MVHQLSNLIQRVSSLESEQTQKNNEIVTLQNLVKDFNERLKKLESNQSEYSTDLDTTKSMVTVMLSEVPQVSSIEERFTELEDRIIRSSQHNECRRTTTQHNSVIQLDTFDDIYATQTSTVSSSMESLDVTSIAEITNEMEERNKRKTSLVVHNLREASSTDEEIATVTNLISEILPDQQEFGFEADPYSKKPRMYRLGMKTPHRQRSLKIHFKSEEYKDQVLANARRLAKSETHQSVVIQKDMTPLQRIHLKRLLHEKKRRNYEARSKQEEPNWTIRGGILCRKTD